MTCHDPDCDYLGHQECRIAELEARQLELVLIVRELIMELNRAHGVVA